MLDTDDIIITGLDGGLDPEAPTLTFFGPLRPRYAPDGWYVSTQSDRVFLFVQISKPRFGLALGRTPGSCAFFHTFKTKETVGVERGSIYDVPYIRCPENFNLAIRQPHP
jgi:hypothetical protein